MTLWSAYLALVVATVTAIALARRRADHWPFAALLCWVSSADIVRSEIASIFGLIRPSDAAPFEGGARLAFHLDQAFEVSGPAWIAALAIWYFARRRWLFVVPTLAWIAVVGYLVTHYPEIRGDALRRVYLGAELAALLASALVIVPWLGRHEIPTPGRICTMAVVVMEALLLFVGPVRWGFFSRWDLNQAVAIVLYALITALQVWIWRMNTR